LHALVAQVPVAQLAVALARLQATAQPPQSLSVSRGVSQPVAGLPSQLAKLALQAPTLHAPPVQLAVALGRVQAEPQPPQLFGSVSVLLQRPAQQAPLAQSPLAAQVAPSAFLQTALRQTEPMAHSTSTVQEVRQLPLPPQV
jgi:hypothetical protein